MPQPPKSIALIHNSSLPTHLRKLSNILAVDCQSAYCAHPGVTIHIFDVAEYDFDSLAPIPKSSSPSTTAEITENTPRILKKPLTQWQMEISTHSGIILLFPYHIWSYCTPLKKALGESLFPHNKTATNAPNIHRMPTLLVGYGKEDIWRPSKPGSDEGWTQRIYHRKSFDMMREWATGRGLRVVAPEVFTYDGERGAGEDEREKVELWPQFDCYDDWWREWERGGDVVIGAQLSESWESAGWNRCQRGMKGMAGMLEVKGKKSF